MKVRSNFIIGLIGVTLFFLTYLEVSDYRSTSSLYVFIMVVVVFFIFLVLLIWQERKSDIFPEWNKFFVGIIPLFLLAMFFVLFSGQMDLSYLLGTIFGLATVFGLAISIAVLVRIREAITTEMELLIDATKLLRTVRKRLIFISLSLNLGYAAAISEHKVYLIREFEDAFKKALKRLNSSSENNIELKIVYLNDTDLETFLTFKASRLKEFSFPVPHEHKDDSESGEKIYLESSIALMQTVQNLIGKGKIERYSSCLTKSGNKLIPENFPPLGIFITDDTAMITYNMSLLDPEPIPLKGHITREKEQVDAIVVFSETYLKGFTKAT